jgi:hypothetical protein
MSNFISIIGCPPWFKKVIIIAMNGGGHGMEEGFTIVTT